MTADRRELRRLDQIQRWMQAVITHPDGVAAGIDSDAARTEVDITADRIDEMVEPSNRRTSIERLEVYANAYYARLLECLREEFPALLHAVGEEVFDGLTFGYLQAYPSTSYTLAELSRRFPKFLEETRPQDEEEGDGPSWPDFMIDLARLERTYSEVFDGPGAERQPRLTTKQILAVDSQQWPHARLIPVPCLRLMSFRFPVQEYATAVRKQEEAAIPEPNPTWLAISRIDYVVRRWSLTKTQFVLLESILAGETVGASIERAAQAALDAGEDFEQLAVRLREWFEEWSSAGFFERISLGDLAH
jgi:hypothetical protein